MRSLIAVLLHPLIDSVKPRCHFVKRFCYLPSKIDFVLIIAQYWTLCCQAVVDWEAAAELILQREDFVARLEKFERLASDPNRFFEKGAPA